MKSRKVLLVVLAFAAATPAVVSAAAPAAAPGAEADTKDLPRLLTQLASPEPAVREAACEALMGLSPAELPALRLAAAATGPLRPDQVEALRSAVTFVLTRQIVLGHPSSGNAFMGVMLSDSLPSLESDAEIIGVTIKGTLAGFAAARYLQGGDVVLGVTYGGQFTAFRTRSELTEFVQKNLQPGANVVLEVRRGEQTISVALKLDYRPLLNGPVLNELEADRLARMAEEAAATARQAYDTQFGNVVAAD